MRANMAAGRPNIRFAQVNQAVMVTGIRGRNDVQVARIRQRTGRYTELLALIWRTDRTPLSTRAPSTACSSGSPERRRRLETEVR